MNQHEKNLSKLFENLEKKRKFERSKKIQTFLLIILFIVALTSAAVGLLGVKTPGYQTGSQEGYRAGYHTALDGNQYNVTAGLSENHNSYDEGYIYGYNEGYSAGQVDHASQGLKASQVKENSHSQNTSNIPKKPDLNIILDLNTFRDLNAFLTSNTPKKPDLNIILDLNTFRDLNAFLNTLIAIITLSITYLQYKLDKKDK